MPSAKPVPSGVDPLAVRKGTVPWQLRELMIALWYERGIRDEQDLFTLVRNDRAVIDKIVSSKHLMSLVDFPDGRQFPLSTLDKIFTKEQNAPHDALLVPLMALYFARHRGIFAADKIGASGGDGGGGNVVASLLRWIRAGYPAIVEAVPNATLQRLPGGVLRDIAVAVGEQGSDELPRVYAAIKALRREEVLYDAESDLISLLAVRQTGDLPAYVSTLLMLLGEANFRHRICGIARFVASQVGREPPRGLRFGQATQDYFVVDAAAPVAERNKRAVARLRVIAEFMTTVEFLDALNCAIARKFDPLDQDAVLFLLQLVPPGLTSLFTVNHNQHIDSVFAFEDNVLLRRPQLVRVIWFENNGRTLSAIGKDRWISARNRDRLEQLVSFRPSGTYMTPAAQLLLETQDLWTSLLMVEAPPLSELDDGILADETYGSRLYVNATNTEAAMSLAAALAPGCSADVTVYSVEESRVIRELGYGDEDAYDDRGNFYAGGNSSNGGDDGVMLRLRWPAD